MALSDREIYTFARINVDNGAITTYAATDERKAKLLKECRQNAPAFYEQTLQDIRSSGYRVTQRVRDLVWSALIKIQAEAFAPTTIDRASLSNIKMVAGGEKKIIRIVDGLNVKQWVGFGWVDEGEATPDELRTLPRAV